MQSRFTNNAQEALNYASRCAGRLKQGYVGTEHILAGLVKEQEGVAHRVLSDNGLQLQQILDMIQELIAFENGTGLKEREGYYKKKIAKLSHKSINAAKLSDYYVLILFSKFICDQQLINTTTRIEPRIT